jgi:uncharacterized protein YjiS (DUF1127 family)
MFASLHTSTMTVRHVQSRGLLSRLAETLRAALTAHAQRQALLNMDSLLLADIGLTAEQAQIEAQKPFWDVPRNWRR